MPVSENRTYAVESFNVETVGSYSFQDLLVELFSHSEPDYLYSLLCNYIYRASGSELTFFSSYNPRSESFKIEKVIGNKKLLSDISNEVIVPFESIYYTLNSAVNSKETEPNSLQNLNIKTDINFITVSSVKWEKLENNINLARGYSILFKDENKVIFRNAEKRKNSKLFKAYPLI